MPGYDTRPLLPRGRRSPSVLPRAEFEREAETGAQGGCRPAGRYRASLLGQQAAAVLAETAAQFRARFADPLPVFNPPVNEIPTICSLSLICSSLHDIHASDFGYQKLADLVFAAFGHS